MARKAIILTSGGLDSATCLAIATSQGFSCYCLSFDYGQKSQAELNAAKTIARKHGANHRIIQLSLGELGGSALTDSEIAVPDYTGSKDIPITYVPARNTIFLSIALGFAEIIEANDIFCGICAVDYSGYPDCRPEYLAAFTKMAKLATKAGINGKPVQFHAPLLYLTKAETIKLGAQLGVDYSQTVSCYQATEQGEACGHCDSCTLRKQGFQSAEISDPTVYVNP